MSGWPNSGPRRYPRYEGGVLATIPRRSVRETRDFYYQEIMCSNFGHLEPMYCYGDFLPDRTHFLFIVIRASLWTPSISALNSASLNTM